MKRILAALLCLLLLTACGGQREEPVPLEDLPEDYSLEQAKSDGCVVIEDDDLTSGQDIWNAFVKASESGKAASVRLCQQYTLGDPSRYDPEYYESIKDDYPLLFFKDVSYDGEQFTSVYCEDGTRYEESYSLLRRFEEPVRSKPAEYAARVSYVLTDDAEAAYQQLQAPLYSSIFPPPNYIPFSLLYFICVSPEADT